MFPNMQTNGAIPNKNQPSNSLTKSVSILLLPSFFSQIIVVFEHVKPNIEQKFLVMLFIVFSSDSLYSLYNNAIANSVIDPLANEGYCIIGQYCSE